MIYPGKRKVFIFYTDQGIEQKVMQLSVLQAQQQGLKDRDIIIESYAVNKSADEVKHWKVDASKHFTFILIGKDGGEKLRTDSVVSTEQLFATIDAMPMRKSEMKEQNK